MPKKAGGLEELLLEGLQDLFDAEKQLVRALPKMAKAANDDELESALTRHLEVTRMQVQRLERIFASMEKPAKSKPCKGMRGIVEEGQEMLGENHEGSIMDASIVEASRKVEHYEMASYEGARAVAQQLGMNETVQLLSETLQEEVQTDRQLAQIGKRLLKDASTHSGVQKTEGEERGRGGRRRLAGRSASARGGSRRAGRSGASAPRTSSVAASGGRTSRGRASERSRGASGHSAHPLTNHDEIRNWAEERGASPACVRGTGGEEDAGMIRLDFPGYSGQESLEHISWDKWFEKFDESNLALMVQETTPEGQKSNFNKLVSREGAQGKERARAAR